MPLPYFPWATANEAAVRACTRYACVYCRSIHAADAHPITRYVRDRAGRTALCGVCEIDTVVPLPLPTEGNPQAAAAASAENHPFHPFHNLDDQAISLVLADWHARAFSLVENTPPASS